MIKSYKELLEEMRRDHANPRWVADNQDINETALKLIELDLFDEAIKYIVEKHSSTIMYDFLDRLTKRERKHFIEDLQD